VVGCVICRLAENIRRNQSDPLVQVNGSSPGGTPKKEPWGAARIPTLPGKGGGPTPGLGGPGLERETRAPTPPPGNPEEGVAWR